MEAEFDPSKNYYRVTFNDNFKYFFFFVATLSLGAFGAGAYWFDDDKYKLAGGCFSSISVYFISNSLMSYIEEVLSVDEKEDLTSVKYTGEVNRSDISEEKIFTNGW